MKVRVTENEDLKNVVREGLKNNDGYCPCVINSKGKPEYKCMCKNFVENTPAGEACHCGLYIKEE